MPAELSSNARGYVHSERFGFGRVDIPAMLSLATAYRLVAPKRVISLTLDTLTKNPRNGNAKPKATATFTMLEELSFVEHVTLSVDIRHRRRGNLKISLVAPGGGAVVSTLFEPHLEDGHADIPTSHMFMSVRHWGDHLQPAQKWTLIIEDSTQNTFYGSGYLQAATLYIHGF